MRALSRRPWRAVTPAMGRHAASANESCAGFNARRSSFASAYWAKEPRPEPKTSSPGLNLATFLPVASTTPARSVPRMGGTGVRIAQAMAPTMRPPLNVCQSAALTDAARTLTSTWSSVMRGRSTSDSCSRSPEPELCRTSAFMVVLWLNASAADIVCLEHRELLTQGQHLGAKPGPRSREYRTRSRGVPLRPARSSLRPAGPSIQGKRDPHIRTDRAGDDHTRPLPWIQTAWNVEPPCLPGVFTRSRNG